MTDHYDVLEAREPAVREADLFARLPDVLHAAMQAPAYAEHLKGIDPSAVKDRGALAILPVLLIVDRACDPNSQNKQTRSAMITLYHCDGARSFRPLWMLEELGLKYELKMLPFPPRVLARDYLSLNPLGTIPLMIDGETRMTESSGICHYLGTKYGPTPLIVGIDEPTYGKFLNWMYFSDATLTFPQTLVLRYSQFEPEERRNPQVAADYTKWFLGRLRAVETAVSMSETLCAGRFTAADIANGYALRLAENIGLAKNFGPQVGAYWDRLQARDGYQRAVASERRAGLEQGIAPRVYA